MTPTPAQVAQARQIVAWHIGLDDELTAAIAAALATAVAEKEAELSARVESAKFDAMVAEGERICNRVFAELPLDANVSDGNESADPADHIVPCVRAALATAHAEGEAKFLPWKDAVIDAAVVSWTYTAADEDDPRGALNRLFACAIREALDPAISQEAQALIDMGRAEGRQAALEERRRKSGESPYDLSIGKKGFRR